MTGEAAVSVPGKTILFGEHAAIYGCAALVAALDHRMTVTARTSANGRELRLQIPSFKIDRMVSLTHPVDAVNEPGDLAILAVAISTADLGVKLPGLEVRIESAIPSSSGFGSSAALAVAVVAACRRACGADDDLENIARLALEVERHQHGQASGVDVQAVLHGGVLLCRRTTEGLAEQEALPEAAERLGAFRLFHSGTPHETTRDMVGAVRGLLDREPARARDAFAAIESSTHDGRAALLRADDSAFVPIVRRAEAALEVLGVVPAGMLEAIRAIESAGGAAKISGAGGLTGAGAGLVLVAHPDPAWHERFTPPSGWIAHRVRLGAKGLREEVAA